MFELKHWEYAHDFSAEELAALMIEIDPRDLGQATSWQTIEPLLRRIHADYRRACEAVKMIFVMHGKLDVENKLKKTGLGLFSIELQNVIDNFSWIEDPMMVIKWIDSPESHIDEQRFSRKAINTWIEQEKLKSGFPFSKENINQDENIGIKNLDKNGKWPWGDHNTQDLEHLAAAAKKFWSYFDPSDPSTAPTNNDVRDWLHKERGVPKERAYYMASILRADGLPDGPRR